MRRLECSRRGQHSELTINKNIAELVFVQKLDSSAKRRETLVNNKKGKNDNVKPRGAVAEVGLKSRFEKKRV